MRVTDNKLKAAIALSNRERPRGECPEDETLAALAEGRLSEAQVDLLLGHLSRCSACLASVLALRRVLGEVPAEGETRVPAKLMARARQLDPAHEGIIEIVIRFAKGLAEVIRMSGGVVGGLAPALDPVRGEGRVVSETLVTFSKEFPPYLAEIEVERAKPGRGEISVNLTDAKNGQGARGLRVSLFAGDEELESAAVEGGPAVFENLKFGQYQLEITRVGEPIGKIALEMKGEGE